MKSLPKWIKFVGLLVPILGLIISFLGYELERQKYTDEIEVLVSTESAVNFEGWGKMHVSPPVSVSIVSENELICGRNLIISNTGGISTALVGFQGQLSHKSFPQPIKFETLGNEVYMASAADSLPEELSSIHITILKDNLWIMSSDSFKDEDILSFPVDVQSHSSFKVRIALELRYKTKDSAFAAFSEFSDKSNSSDKRVKLSLQFLTSTSKITKPVEFNCYEGVYFLPISTPTPNSP